MRLKNKSRIEAIKEASDLKVATVCILYKRGGRKYISHEGKDYQDIEEFKKIHPDTKILVLEVV